MKIKVGVLFGGLSVEHEVSIISAVQAMNHIDSEKYSIVPIYITRKNEMYTGDKLTDIAEYSHPEDLLKSCQRVILVNDDNRVNLVKYPPKMFGSNIIDYIDVAMPIVHGTNVEDGCLQGYLKTLNIPFVGCDVLSSALGMDKFAAKVIMREAGIPVLDCKKFNSKEYFKNKDAIISDIEARFAYPLIVKPIDLGSSVGIKKAADRKALEEAIEYAFEFANIVLVEHAVSAIREINCAVLGDYESAKASECEEPINTDEILSYSDKYINGSKSSGSKGMASSKRKLPADLSPEVREKIRKMAVDTFQALGCNGVSRIDFIMDSQTQEIWVNEINTIPGSLSFYLWEPLGISYKALLDELISLALKRARESADIVYSIDTGILSSANISGMKTGFSKLGR